MNRLLVCISFAPLLLSAAVGCRTPHRVQVENGTPKYNAVNVVYDLRGGTQTAFIHHLPKVQQARFTDESAEGEELTTSHELPPDWTRASLQIQFPHPDGRPDLARATLRLSKRPLCPVPIAPQPGATADETKQTPADLLASADDEIWTLDMPKYQVDLLLFDLANSGYFDGQVRPSGGAMLSVGVDRGRTSKAWTPEPRLNDLLMRVYDEGMLDGFADPTPTPVVIADAIEFEDDETPAEEAPATASEDVQTLSFEEFANVDELFNADEAANSPVTADAADETLVE